MEPPPPVQKDGRILVVEDDPSVLRLVSYILGKEGYQVDTAQNGALGWDKVQSESYDLIITDIRMPVMDGLELLQRIKSQMPDAIVLVLSAFGNKDVAIEALKLGAYDYLKKPLDNQRLRAVVRYLIPTGPVAAADASVQFGGLVGYSPAMQELFSSIQRIARYRTPILILGEPGVGKKRVAKAIHLASPRSTGPFEVFDCEATASTPLEGMLWGRPGAVSSEGTESPSGVLESARGGTVLLAELGFLSDQNQQRLLSSLKSSSISLGAPRFGEKEEMRFISTTNTAIRKAVESGQFSEDLMYRLRGVVLEVPPLRARKEDIVSIAQIFAQEAGISCAEEWLSNDTLQVLMDYRWPMNGRELRSVIDNLAQRCGDRIVTVADLGARFRGTVAFD